MINSCQVQESCKTKLFGTTAQITFSAKALAEELSFFSECPLVFWCAQAYSFNNTELKNSL